MSTAKEIRNKGFIQFAIGVAGYMLVVILAGFLVDPETVPTVYGVLLAVVPMVAALWGMAGWLRAIRTFDELQQKVFSEAGLIALGITAAATFTYGFLEVYVNAPHVSMFVVFPLIAATFGLAMPFVTRRYS